MSKARPPRLGNWIFVQFVALLVVIVAPLFAMVLFTTESGFRGYVYQGDIDKAMAFAPLLEKEFAKAGSWQAVEPVLAEAPFTYGAAFGRGDFDRIQERVVILDTSREVVVDSKHVLVGTMHPPGHLAEAVVLKNPEKWTIGYLLVGTMVDPALTQNHATLLSTMAVSLLALFLLSLGLSVPLALWLGSRLSRPLRSLVEGTRRAAAGDWRWTLPRGAPKEVAELHEAFVTLGAHLQASEDRKAQLLADAAHELRTPLTVVQGTLEAMIDGVFPLEPEGLRAVYDETVRLGKIVDSIRLLEDLHRAPMAPVEFAWRPLVARVVDLFQAQAAERGQTLHLACPDHAAGRGEPDAMTQVLVNLVSNALHHSPDGGTVRIEVVPAAGETVLAVEDEGPGIPEADRDRVFERFVRLDPSRSGKTGGRGLGLAIVKQIVDRHGGSVRVTDGRTGGARFEVHFPS